MAIASTVNENIVNGTSNITQNANSKNSQIKLHRIYTKSSLFEAASLTIALIEHPPQPTINLQIFANSHTPDRETFEAVLSLQLSAKHNDSLLWRVQLQQAGLYTLEGFTEEQQKQVLNVFCMSQLYPHACVVVSNLVTQGGFLPVYLSPVNFEELYQQQLKAKETSTVTA